MARKPYDYMLKLLLVGDAVGKTNMIARVTKDTFSLSHIPTIGVDFGIKTSEIDTSSGTKIVKLQIWDTSSQDRFRTITTAYYRGAQGIMVVFDVTDQETFDNAINKWMKQIDEYASADVVKMIVGNKCDLEESRVVSRERAQLVADDMGAMYSEVSAKTGHNMDQTFYDIACKSLKL